MKKLLLILFILCCCSELYAQQYVPMPTDSAWWRGRGGDGDNGYHTYIDALYYVNGEDTVMGGVTYTKLFSRMYSIGLPNWEPEPPVTTVFANAPDAFIGGIREDNKVVYIRRYDDIEREYFDFNYQIGDVLYSDVNYTLTISAIDNVLYGTNYRKRFTISSTPPGITDYYTEGIGSDKNGIISMMGWEFHCFHSEQSTNAADYSSIIWQPDSCTTIYPYIDPAYIPSQSLQIGVLYPNPATDMVVVNATTNGVVELYNAIGQKQKSSSIDKGQNIIDIRALPAGLYNAIIRDGSNNITRSEKIVKQ